MAFAATSYHDLLTNDLDFAPILASSHEKKPSVVQIRAEDLVPNTIACQITTALRRMHEELQEGSAPQ